MFHNLVGSTGLALRPWAQVLRVAQLSVVFRVASLTSLVSRGLATAATYITMRMGGLFLVDFRPVGHADWVVAAPVVNLDVGVGSRVIHSATLSELDFATEHEYRVHHLRAGAVIDTYRSVFRTRLPAHDDATRRGDHAGSASRLTLFKF